MPRPARPAAALTRTTPGPRQRSDKYFSKVIGKALDLIAILRSSPAAAMSLNELTLRLELVKSSVFRILHTLEVSGLRRARRRGPLQRWRPICGPGRPGSCAAALVEAAMPALQAN